MIITKNMYWHLLTILIVSAVKLLARSANQTWQPMTEQTVVQKGHMHINSAYRLLLQINQDFSSYYYVFKDNNIHHKICL